MNHKDALAQVIGATHTLTRFRPYAGTGNTGAFDVVCSPGARTMRVEVRVAWQFEDAYGSAERIAFKRNVVEQVDKYWSGRFRLRLYVDPSKLDLGQRTPGPEYSYPIAPTFVVTEGDQPHFTIRVADSRYKQSFVTADGGCVLFRGTDTEFQSSLHNQLQHRQGALGKIGNVLFPIPGVDAVTHFRALEDKPITFVANSDAYTAEGRRTLDELSWILKQDLPTFELVEVQVVGHTAKGERADLGQRRADAVRRDLVAKGAPAIQLKARPSKSLGSARVGSVLLKLEKDPREKLVANPHPWPVAAHEFGHMLGLLDEYKPEAEQQDAELRAFFEDCVKYQVIAPRFGVRGTSLMSWGYHVYPAHYVTLARALEKMVSDSAKRSLPKVVEHTPFLKALRVGIDPLALKKDVEHEQTVNYLDWLAGAYSQV